MLQMTFFGISGMSLSAMLEVMVLVDRPATPNALHFDDPAYPKPFKRQKARHPVEDWRSRRPRHHKF